MAILLIIATIAITPILKMKKQAWVNGLLKFSEHGYEKVNPWKSVWLQNPPPYACSRNICWPHAHRNEYVSWGDMAGWKETSGIKIEDRRKMGYLVIKRGGAGKWEMGKDKKGWGDVKQEKKFIIGNPHIIVRSFFLLITSSN